MYSNKNVSFDENKLIESFQEHIRPLLGEFFKIIKPYYEKYLQANLLGEDQSLAFYEEVNLIFLKSFLFYLEDPAALMRLVGHQGHFETAEREFFVKSHRIMIYLDNSEDANGLFSDKVMEIFFDRVIKEKFPLREDKEFNVFKEQLRQLVKALHRPEIFEIFYLATQHAVKAGIYADGFFNKKVLNFLVARVVESSGYSVFKEEEYERKVAEAYENFSAQMKDVIPSEKMHEIFLKCFRPILIEPSPKNKIDYFEKL